MSVRRRTAKKERKKPSCFLPKSRNEYAHSSVVVLVVNFDFKHNGSASCSIERCRATLRFSHFMNEILQLRGTNTCTVKAAGMQTRVRHMYMLGCCTLWSTCLGVAELHGCLADDFLDVSDWLMCCSPLRLEA